MLGYISFGGISFCTNIMNFQNRKVIFLNCISHYSMYTSFSQYSLVFVLSIKWHHPLTSRPFRICSFCIGHVRYKKPYKKKFLALCLTRVLFTVLKYRSKVKHKWLLQQPSMFQNLLHSRRDFFNWENACMHH